MTMIKIGDIVLRYAYGVPQGFFRVVGFRIASLNSQVCTIERHDGSRELTYVEYLTLYQPKKHD